jgi:hypothetical protein
MAELVAHPITGKPSIKVIHFTEEGERIDYEERELTTLQANEDQAAELRAVRLEQLNETKRKADLMIREAQEQFDEAETRLEDCKSQHRRGQEITANPGAYQGAEATSSPRPADVLGTAGSGFGIAH